MSYLSKTFKALMFISAGTVVSMIIWALGFVAFFHGDTYGKSEAYVIDTLNDSVFSSASDIVELLYRFQCSHPNYQVIDVDTYGGKYHNFSNKIENRTNQYMCFFYFKDINTTFSCIAEISAHNNPLVKLYAINEGPIFKDWKRINNHKEISLKKNKQMKKKFETEVLDSLGVTWRHKRFWD